MDYNIESYVGVGPVRFGMTTEQVRMAIGSPFRTFQKTKASKFPTDSFDGLGVHVYYAPSGICEAIEMGRTARPQFNRIELFRLSFVDALHWLKNLDSLVETDNSGLTALGLGIGLYVPGVAKDDSLPIEGVIAFKRGYYGA